ncbi:MAG: multidrug ABC transporter permease [Candidatus Buchananbacteria bacterium RIFCSPHIGHO2_02_FULL_45_11b]|uniref:Transport permease protein n=3 Tax=Candidatus Buchananiibacteriota TaxID=1817903 RepID=A0A1G1Y1Z7_9BACT|nr:MAG: multidrug ABC transporter permease [Candidatus Buchananbacteria bacterium RIFCSPHIGHO2_01_FULL_46_12]OGY52551.1 MAG: multidrug ABC transporter permease [Candidatus Buchananbacteria bacterium RIFCSPHIGHO2_02_FULL_45_11b]OGY54233.1 MAG: multidrug ABC transporter permease [Candidatus Buchananbacteria bacterium RIFCSPLOWO2_01_FULL_45_31]
MSIIYILWLRQLKRYWRSRSRLLGSLGQPLLFLVAMGFGFGPIYQKAGEGNYIQFLGPGIIAMGIIFTAIFSGIELIWDRQFGFLKETLVAPVSRFQIMIGRTLGGATVAALQGILVFFIALVVGFRPVSLALMPLALVFVILISMVFTALGTLLATKLSDMHAFPIIMNFLIMPIFFLSGALFPLKGFPAPVLALMKLNPLLYGVDGLRGALVSGAHLGLLTDFAVLSIVSLVFIAIGSYFFSKVEI